MARAVTQLAAWRFAARCAALHKGGEAGDGLSGARMTIANSEPAVLYMVAQVCFNMRWTCHDRPSPRLARSCPYCRSPFTGAGAGTAPRPGGCPPVHGAGPAARGLYDNTRECHCGSPSSSNACLRSRLCRNPLCLPQGSGQVLPCCAHTAPARERRKRCPTPRLCSALTLNCAVHLSACPHQLHPAFFQLTAVHLGAASRRDTCPRAACTLQADLHAGVAALLLID